MLFLSPSSQGRPSLRELTAAPDYFARVGDVVQRVERAIDAATLVDLLQGAVQQIGGDVAFFLSFLRDGDCDSFRFLLACDPRWCVDYERQAWYADDPWLAYAKRRAEPIRASELKPCTESEVAVLRLAEEYGFRSTVVVPAPASGGLTRLGVLCLGSRTAGFYEDEGFAAFKVISRPLASALHEGCIRVVREEIQGSWRITPEELAMLEYELKGLSTKEIAKLLGKPTHSVDYRFKAVIAKLGVLSRKAAARLAAEYGLI